MWIQEEVKSISTLYRISKRTKMQLLSSFKKNAFKLNKKHPFLKLKLRRSVLYHYSLYRI